MFNKLKKMMLILSCGFILCTACANDDNRENDRESSNREENINDEDDSTNSDEDKIKVDCLEDFIEAIKPDTNIIIKRGEYNLTEYINEVVDDDLKKWNKKHKYVQIEECFDGYELVISGVDNLSISGKTNVEIQIEPRYADVLKFQDCSDISISYLTVGHTIEQGSCEGDVLEFSNCSDVELSELDLYGCGTYTITAYDSDDFTIDGCLLHECSYGIMRLNDCSKFNFTDCTMEYCQGYTMLDIMASKVCFEKCIFDNNSCDDGFVSKDESNVINFKSCTFGTYESESAGYGLNVNGCYYDDDCCFVEEAITDTDPSDSCDTVIVSNTEELFEAMAPDITIIMEPGYYNITKYMDYIEEEIGVANWNNQHKYVQIEEVFDGFQFNIFDCRNMFIMSNSEYDSDMEYDSDSEYDYASNVQIVTEPRYADVLCFDNCYNLYMEGISIGHTDIGDCTGAVIKLIDCDDSSFVNMNIYGCGVYGFEIYSSDYVFVERSYIHDCKYGFADVYDLNGQLNFCDCRFADNGGTINYDYGDGCIGFDNCVFSSAESYLIVDREDLELSEDCEYYYDE